MLKGRKDTTFDNGSTYTEVRYLAKVPQATADEQYKEAILKDIDFMLSAQYENGGWPQVYPPDFSGYSRYITFNDNAMIGVISLLSDVAEGSEEYVFIDGERQENAAQAVQQDIECILQCQIIVDGHRTTWCAQHDHRTLKPQMGRVYEYPSLSESESVDIVRFLMNIENLSPENIAAIEGAVTWFEAAKLTGIRVDTIYDDVYPEGYDLITVEDEKADPLWARFYEIGTNIPIFADVDGSIKETLAGLSIERRTGYRWLLDKSAVLIYEEYPAWQQAQQQQDGNQIPRYLLIALITAVIFCAVNIVLMIRKRYLR